MTSAASVVLNLPELDHVGIVVLDLEAASSSFERRWGASVTNVEEVTLHRALYHHRPSTIAFRRGEIRYATASLELIQPLSNSPFRDFLRERKGDGVHHLAYVVADIDIYLERLKPTAAELVMDAEVPGEGRRTVYLDGFAHGPTVELIQIDGGQRTSA